MINEIEYNIENIAKEVLGNDFKFRENQLEIIAKIVRNCIEEKSNHQTHLVQAPTGTGKSIILIISALVLLNQSQNSGFLLAALIPFTFQETSLTDIYNLTPFVVGNSRSHLISLL